MGLDTTHDCWHGSYGAFGRWRTAVAVAEGFSTERTEWGSETYVFPRDQFSAGNYAGEWDPLPDDPLMILLVHSDCDGIIHWEHAGLLADRLERVVPKLPAIPEIVYGSYPPDWRGAAEQFVAGLRAAHAAHEDVDFH